VKTGRDVRLERLWYRIHNEKDSKSYTPARFSAVNVVGDIPFALRRSRMSTPNQTTRIRSSNRQGVLLTILVPDTTFNTPYFLRIQWDDGVVSEISAGEIL
jgi:hypothetical protein